VNFRQRSLERSGQSVSISDTEFALLKLLLSHPLEVLSRERIVELMYGTANGISDRASTCRSGACAACSTRTPSARAISRPYVAVATPLCRTRPRTAFRNEARIDTLFGRMALLIAAVLVISHFSWLAILRMDRRQQQIDYSVEQMIFQLDSIQRALDATPPLPLPSLVEVADATADEHAAPQAGRRPRRLVEQFTRRLPPGTEVARGRTVHAAAVDQAAQAQPMDRHADPVRAQPAAGQPAVAGRGAGGGMAIIFALLVAWQIQRPVRDMAEAAKSCRASKVSPLRERGPHELRQLIERFNRMVADLVRIDQERNTMLAGIAHDLKTPLARLRLRAEMLSDPKAAGVTRDVESMSAIVEQFLTFAQSSEPTARPVPVDKRIGELAASLAGTGRQVVLELNAGDGFRMIATQLDRIIGNLVDNAYAYGEPPVYVATAARRKAGA
jgi:two-component system osmolarity sensor histidine kinase EnvZ